MALGGRFGSVLTAMVTPFDGEGALDLEAAVTIARWLQEQGNDGLVVAGTTGEAPVLSDDERLDLFRAVSEAVTIPIVAGTGTYDTRHSVHLTEQAKACGAAGVLVVGPYYNRPAQSGLEAHFRAVAAATDLPVVLYDVPNIVGFKDATGDPNATAGLVADLGDAIEVYSGDDGMTLPLLAVGAAGVIGVATHWTGHEHQELVKLWHKGDTAGARGVNARLLPSFAYETGDEAPNPIPTKVMMNLLGLDVGEARLPMGPPPEWVDGKARAVLAGLDRADEAR